MFFSAGCAGAQHSESTGDTAFVAPSSLCDHPPVSALTYHYPVRPFDRQHPIRGFFGDPRTLVMGPFGRDTPRSAGSFTFHNGVDIVANAGTPVYPVVSGVVDAMHYADEISVDTNDGRVFQYFHIAPRVRVGETVIAYRTVLGTVRRGWRHVHLTEIDGFRVHNPLDPGHLEPYRDHTPPSVDRLLFRAEDGHDVSPKKLRGRVFVAADAEDFPPIPVPGEWYGFPATPAYVAWHLRSRSGKLVVRNRVVADFRKTLPPNRDFWRVYAAGTYQNFPVFGHRYFFHQPGRYLFNLAPDGLDTSRLRNGSYALTVDVGDVCGNTGSYTQWMRVDNST